ncbi:unnamed protein product [Paramecium sonneborni]|uniref:Transmembrane protein n=1 Tax=Paramecium sonneborni TaxID=65129 RepID=A0A8S1RFW8_9CILI|nr:unnamed protein product [Paramecium sonneborni]
MKDVKDQFQQKILNGIYKAIKIITQKFIVQNPVKLMNNNSLAQIKISDLITEQIYEESIKKQQKGNQQKLSLLLKNGNDQIKSYWKMQQYIKKEIIKQLQIYKFQIQYNLNFLFKFYLIILIQGIITPELEGHLFKLLPH